MSQELERVYTIPLGKVLLSADNRRAKRAINMIKEFARHHMKNEDVRIEEEVAHIIWSRGIKHPPRKIRVRMTRTDEGFVLISPYDEEVEAETKDNKKKPEVDDKAKEVAEVNEEATEETKVETPAVKTPQETKKETPKKETPKKETPKKETPKKETPKKETPKKETPKKK